jgi:hypothetical protein
MLSAAGHKEWAVQNTTKTDKNFIFDARNLKTLAACLDPADAGVQVMWHSTDSAHC